MQSLVEFDLAVLEKNFLVNFANACILANISFFLSPFGKGHGPLYEKNLSPAVCQFWLIIVQWFWR